MAEQRVTWHEALHSGEENTWCEPTTNASALSARLDYIVSRDQPFPSNCDRASEGIPELCDALRRVAIDREVLVAVCDSNVLSQLKLFLSATRKAGITNVLIIALDRRLADFLEREGVAHWLRVDSAKGSHKISAQKFKFIGALLSVGASVLVSDIDVIYVQNPFRYLHRDSDVEGTTDGWDAATAYGWSELAEDEPFGWAKHVYSHRSTAYNSGLWYIQGTLGGERLLKLLAHRMSTESTWDQTAYNEEVGLPARGMHSGAAVTRRAANYLCFTNSKTLLRRVLRDRSLSLPRHTIVESHVNYHAGKPQIMQALYDAYHDARPDSLGAIVRREPLALRNTTTLEAKDWLQINGGFVGGRALHASAKAAFYNSWQPCTPPPPMLGFKYPLHYVHPPSMTVPQCSLQAPGTEGASPTVPCEVMRALPFERGRPLRALLLAVGSADLEALPVCLEALRRLTLKDPLLVAPLDDAAAEELANMEHQMPEASVLLAHASIGTTPSSDVGVAGSAVAFDLVASLLRAGVGTMLLSPRVVMLRDAPLDYLHGDADVEVASEGWDDTSAYGYNHVLDDPSMGHTRSCHGLRIAAHDAWMTYAAPTHEAATLYHRIAQRLRAIADGRACCVGGELDVHGESCSMLCTLSRARASATAVASLLLSQELFLPSHNTVQRSGSRTRVSNILCFGNSKLFFSAHLHEQHGRHTPVAVHVSYHEHPAKHMRALLKRYADGDAAAVTPLLTERVSKKDKAWCAGPRRKASAADAQASPLVAHVSTHGPWSWSGMEPLHFRSGGKLETPWGVGSWGLLSGGTEEALFADFVGNKHNLRFEKGHMAQFTSARCGDAEPVIGRCLGPACSS